MKKRLFILILVALLLISIPAMAAGITKTIQANYGVSIVLDGKTINYTYPDGTKAEAFTSDGVTYLPVRAIAEALGVGVTWDGGTQTVTLSSSGSAPPPTPSGTATTGQKNALAKAKEYLNYSAFSRQGLIEQLEYEKFSHADAVYAVDNCGADWFEQAAKMAKQYLDYSSFSRQGLIDQLEYEGFTHEQAVYGVEANGY